MIDQYEALYRERIAAGAPGHKQDPRDAVIPRVLSPLIRSSDHAHEQALIRQNLAVEARLQTLVGHYQSALAG